MVRKPLMAQPVDAFETLPAEAPASIFDVKYGSADAQLLIKGSWDATTTFQGGLALNPSSGVGLADEQPLLFAQTPDLYISFLLFKQLFAEIRVSNDPTQTFFAVGYKGGEGQFLREVRVGNEDISFPTLPFLTLGDGNYQSFGVAAKFGQGPFDGRAMVRYDQATRVDKQFVGSAQVTETNILASAYVRGQWFVAPSGDNISNLVLYIQSVSGNLPGSDGNVYRQMQPSEYSYSAVTGLISLTVASTTKLLAYYPAGTSGSPTVTMTGSGRTCLVLYDPVNGPLNSAYLDLGRYPVTSGMGTDAYVQDMATGLKDTNYSVRVDSSGYIEVVHNGSVDVHSWEWQQPFQKDIPDLYTTNFTPPTTQSQPQVQPYQVAFSKQIVVRLFQTQAKITIDTDVIAGSVEVWRDGVQYYDFTVDANGGTLTLATPPGLDENIEVSYLRESSDRSSGSLAAGVGGILSLGKDSSAWAALGLRWSLPGTSYAASGISDPGSVVLTAGEQGLTAAGRLSHSLAIAGSWSTEVASGRYRIEGMENTQSYNLSFTPSEPGHTGAIPDFSAQETTDLLLNAVFPNLVASLHADGSTQKALDVVTESTLATTPPNSATLDLVEYVDPPPVSSLKTFSFYARKVAGTMSNATILVQLDQGTKTSAELSISIPASALSTAWQRYVLRYGSGDNTVYKQASENGPLAPVGTAAVGSANLSLTSAGRLFVEIANAQAGDEFWIDEILLDDSVGQAALLYDGQAAYKDPDAALTIGSVKLAQGIDAAADSTGSLSSDPWVSGGASLATAFGPLAVGVHARGSASGEGDSLRGGHTLSFSAPGLPIGFKDDFDMDPEEGSFGHDDSASLVFGQLFSLTGSESSAWAGMDTTGTGLFSQSWKAQSIIGSGIFDAEFSASNTSYPTGYAGPIGNYFDSWIDSFNYLFPAFEEASSLRQESLSSSIGLSSGRDIIKLTASVSGQPSAAVPLRDDAFSLRVQAPLQISSDLALSPYYQRAWTAEINGAGTGLLDLTTVTVSDIEAVTPFWNAPLFGELFSNGSYDMFTSYCAAAGITTATYTPELGIEMVRNYGSRLADLVVPSGLTLAWTNESSVNGSTYLFTRGVTASAKFGAINLFGAFGAYPLTTVFDSDEYSANYQVSVQQAEGDSSLQVSMVLQNLVTLYGGGGHDSLTADNRWSLTEAPSSVSWSETLALSLTKAVERSWLLDLWRIAMARLPAAGSGRSTSQDGGASDSSGSPAAVAGSAPSPRPSIVSDYLSGLANEATISQIIYTVKANVSSEQSDADTAELSLDASESVQFKLTIPQKLTLAVTPAFVQTRDGSTGILVFGLSLAVEATISF
jgi:hypothetical protein